MSIIMFVGTHGYGHINPTLPIVSKLVQLGHKVIYYNDESFRMVISKAGADFRPYPLSANASPDRLAEAINKHTVEVSLHLMKSSMILTGFMKEEIDQEKPTLVIFDSVALWGMQATRLAGVPSLSSITMFITNEISLPLKPSDYLYFLPGVIARLPRFLIARRALIKRFGRKTLPKKNLFPAVAESNIVFTSRDLQPDTSFIDDSYHFVGPSLAIQSDDFQMDFPDERPLVYISFGTIHTMKKEFLRTCFEAFADMECYFVVSTGGRTVSMKAPSNFLVKDRVPQLEVLKRADVFITHAGMNSLQESLYHGVPMVFLPQQMEQLINARIVQARGAGIIPGKFPPYGKQPSAIKLREAVQEILANPDYLHAAKGISLTLQTAGGTQKAVEIIQRLLQDIAHQ